jgi:hypothetical protein
MTKKKAVSPPAVPDGPNVLARVIAEAAADVTRAKADREAENARLAAKNKKLKGSVKEELSYSIYFGRRLGNAIAEATNPFFGMQVVSGEVQSASAEGEKRVDVSYSTAQRGLGFMISLKSVHRGERDGGAARFAHNIKRNMEELRVEATALHLRQPYAVLVAMLVLPLEACDDGWKSQGDPKPKSSFARWVEKFWMMKGRIQPDDPPDRFELVLIALYARDGSVLGFYEVGGAIACPRVGRPSLMTFPFFVERLKTCYYDRNQRDFRFEGEAPSREEPEEEPDEPEG